MSESFSNRRASPRFPLHLVTEVRSPGDSTIFSGRSSEVSRNGCYIDTVNPPSVGTQVELRLMRNDGVFRTTARVMYVCPGLGMGVAFANNLTPEQLAILDRWLQEAAQPDQ